MAEAFFYSSTAGAMTLVGSTTGSATSITVNDVTGLPASTPFKLVLDPGLPTEEIVKVTALAGTTLTVVRGWDGTTGQAHANAGPVRHMVTAEDLRLARVHESSATGVHGLAGTVVGTSDVQTLTNKTLTDGTNQFPTSLARKSALDAHTGATTAHGTSGAVVGTSDIQTLTGKTIDGSANTLSNIPESAVVNLTADLTAIDGRLDAAEAKIPGSVPATTAAKAGKKLHWGVASITTDASGYATITHGGGFTPTVIVLINNNGQKWVTDTVGGTTFRVRALQSDGSPYPALVTTIMYIIGE